MYSGRDLYVIVCSEQAGSLNPCRRLTGLSSVRLRLSLPSHFTSLFHAETPL